MLAWKVPSPSILAGHLAPVCAPVRPLENFRTAVQPVIPPVWRCLRRFGVQPDELEDALQTVLLGLFRNWEKLKEASPRDLRSYACCASVGVARDFRRSRIRSSRRLSSLSSEEEDFVEAQTGDPEVLTQRSQAIAVLNAVLRRMPDDLREVFVLHVIEQLSKRELASQFGIPEGTAASRIRRAREEFSRVLSEIEGTSKGNSP